MTDLLPQLDNVLYPYLGLVFMGEMNREEPEYVEVFDIGRDGRPINSRPLTEQEADALASKLRSKQREGTGDKGHWLKTEGILPPNLLRLDQETTSLIWYTEPRRQVLYTTTAVGLPEEPLWLPSLLWKATTNELYVFALETADRPTPETPLFYAPLFNVYEDGRVCMGTVDRPDLARITSVEMCIQQWEHRFFHSYFSHTNHMVTKSALIPLLQRLMRQQTPFPIDELVPTHKTVQNVY